MHGFIRLAGKLFMKKLTDEVISVKVKTGTRKTFAVIFVVFMAMAAALAVTDAAFASPTAGPGLAWEEPLKKLQESITGPVAMAISLIAIIAAGAALIFGGDMTGFMRTTVYIVLVLGIIVSASGLLSSLFGTSATLPFAI
jgi:type IV secretion system protein VirB2